MKLKVRSLEEISELKKIRLLLGWCQLKLAQELGVSSTLICRIEQGLKEASPDLSKKLQGLKSQIETELSKMGGGDNRK